jgi:hypothetical protein
MSVVNINDDENDDDFTAVNFTALSESRTILCRMVG